MGYKETSSTRKRSRSRSPPASDRNYQQHRSGYNNYGRHSYSNSYGSSNYSDRRRYGREEYENFDNRDYKRSRKEESSNDQQSNVNNTSPQNVNNNSNPPSSTPIDEEKRQKLEALKKKLAEKNFAQKLAEQREQLEKKKQEQKTKIMELKKHEEKKSTSSNKLPFASIHPHSKSSKGKISLDFKMEEEDETAVQAAPEEEEMDSLDAFMLNMTKEQGIDQLKVVTLDDIVKKESTNGTSKEEEDTEQEDDEEFHKQFLASLKREEHNQETNKDEVTFNDSIDEEYVVHDDYFDLSAAGTVVGGDERISNKKELKQVDHSKMNYQPFRKNFFIVPRELASLSSAEIEKLREVEGIKVRGKDIPPPIKTWLQCGLNDTVLKTIEANGYTKPFAIQSQAIPCIMSGRDVIGIAKTGSGKTMAFLLPMIRHVLDQPTVGEGEGPIGLIIAPTRELSVQIFNDLKPFAKPLGIRAICAYGGVSIADQIKQFKQGAHIVVCTPGRMIDLLCANKGRVVNLSRVSFVVLDEADRMFDLGFTPQVTKIVDNIRPDRQIVLFSATFPKPLEALARKTLHNPAEIIVGGRSVSSDTVKQFVEVRNEETKFLRLLELLGQWVDKGLILIFVDTQNEVGDLYKEVTAAGYEALSLHGRMDQLDRDDTLRSFKNKEKPILIATSLAARGLDVKNLELVINYKVPNHYEDYVHRVGRTGRAGKQGVAYTFITHEEEKYAKMLIQALEQSKNAVPPELIKLHETYQDKKKHGLVSGPDYDAGFGLQGYKTTGFKFDESEMNQKKEDIKRQMISLGMEDEIDDTSTVATTLANVDEADTKISTHLSTIREVKVTTPSSANITDIFANIQKAKQFAESLSNAMGTSVTGSTFMNEIEINDLPQIARYRAVQKENLYSIMDFTGATISSKGIYVEPGKQAPFGERKLYLLIEGSTRESVERATIQIERVINEALVMAKPELAQRKTGKYKVV